ncbi:uncharacterized protein [Aristolochia californica]|uniref:uncharacterized protein isoform X2 n=1 Tax=Aristolochia californica TaxID=171875 RepID=UPI0035D5B00A
MNLKCRVWWPRQLLSSEPDKSLILFGWFVRSSFSSLDVVVANAVPVHRTLCSFSVSDLQRSLHSVNGEISMLLQDHAIYTTLGYCRPGSDYEMLNGRLTSVLMEEVATTKATDCSFASPPNSQKIHEDANCIKSHETWWCGCQKLDGFLKSYKESSITSGNWIQFTSSPINISKEVSWIPKLHHIHFEGQLLSCCDAHVIIYEQPNFGAHHFSSTSWNYSEQQQSTLKRPKWVDELLRRQQLSDLDMVFLALNSADAAKMIFNGYQVLPSTYKQLIWSSVAIFVASISTLLYFILQFCHKCLSYGSQRLIYKALAMRVCHTWKNVHIRCCQLVYWPIFLQSSCSRGRKWNPLRQRLDSYDYTVEQHVMGSLLFTPVLLMLPTTSVFYIFFTIMKTTMSCICILVEVAISILHATPYTEIFLWMARPQRFPSGVWFKILSAQSMEPPTSPEHVFVGDGHSPSDSVTVMPIQQSSEVSGIVVSILQSNFANIEQIILPYYRKVFQGVSLSSGASWAYGIFSGKSVPSALHTRLPPPMPWIHMRYDHYWWLCHDLVLACGLGNSQGLFESSTRPTY